MRTFAEKQTPTHQVRAASPAVSGRAYSVHDDAVRAQVTTPSKVGHDFSRIPVHRHASGNVESPSAPGAYQTRSTVERYPLRATIRRGARAPGSHLAQAAPFRADAAPGQEHGGEEHRALFEQLGAILAGSVGPAGGTTANGEVSTAREGSASGTTSGVASPGEPVAAPIKVPDIEIPALAELGKSDDVMAGFGYYGSITRGGAAPSGFGVTRSFSSRLSGVTIIPFWGTYYVAAVFEHPITYQIRSGTGPAGQVDIASATDADITQANYATVVSDLTPDMSDLNGRPPRTGFWAEDLTLRHELVHANDDRANGPGAMATVTTWLNGQTAASAGDVTTLLGALPGRFASALLAALSTDDGERHAYGDGAPSYTARANAIKAKGDGGEYP